MIGFKLSRFQTPIWSIYLHEVSSINKYIDCLYVANLTFRCTKFSDRFFASAGAVIRSLESRFRGHKITHWRNNLACLWNTYIDVLNIGAYIILKSSWRIKLVYTVLVLTALVYTERRLIEPRLTGARLSALVQAALVYTVLVCTHPLPKFSQIFFNFLTSQSASLNLLYKNCGHHLPYFCCDILSTECILVTDH